MEAQVPGPGWYDDGTGQTRWWDGAAWTQHVAPVAEPAVEAAPAAPEPAAAAGPAEPLRPGAPDPVRSAAADARPSLPAEDRAPEVPVTEQTFVPASFVTEQSFAPQMAYAGGAPPVAAPSGGTYLHHAPEPAAVPAAGASRFGGVAAPSRGGMAGLEHTKVVESSGGRGWVIALIVVAVLAVVGLTAWRIFGPDSTPKATPEVVAAAVQSAAPKGDLPRGFTSAGDIGGYKILKSCSTGGSCRTVQIAARSTCKRLSALVLFASETGNRLGSDVVMAKNVKAGKPATLQAVIPAGGGTTVRVSSVVCQQF